MTSHGEDEVVSASMLGFSTHLLFQDFYYRFIGDVFVGFGVGIVIQTTGGRKNLDDIKRRSRDSSLHDVSL